MATRWRADTVFMRAAPRARGAAEGALRLQRAGGTVWATGAYGEVLRRP